MSTGKSKSKRHVNRNQREWRNKRTFALMFFLRNGFNLFYNIITQGNNDAYNLHMFGGETFFRTITGISIFSDIMILLFQTTLLISICLSKVTSFSGLTIDDQLTFIPHLFYCTNVRSVLCHEASVF